MQPKMKLEIGCLPNINVSRQSDKKVMAESQKAMLQHLLSTSKHKRIYYCYLITTKNFLKNILYFFNTNLSKEQKISGLRNVL